MTDQPTMRERVVGAVLAVLWESQVKHNNAFLPRSFVQQVAETIVDAILAELASPTTEMVEAGGGGVDIELPADGWRWIRRDANFLGLGYQACRFDDTGFAGSFSEEHSFATDEEVEEARVTLSQNAAARQAFTAMIQAIREGK